MIDDLQDIICYITDLNMKTSAYNPSFIHQITVNGYKNISGGCPKLQHLIINDCYTLRDDMIVAVAANCHNIRCISFLYTPNITDVALKALAVHRKLQQIRIEGRSKVIRSQSHYFFHMMFCTSGDKSRLERHARASSDTGPSSLMPPS